MTKIIDGIVYGSTKFGKSKLLVSSQNNYNERTDEVDTTDFNYFDEGLYVTEKGRFFVETRTYGGGSICYRDWQHTKMKNGAGNSRFGNNSITVDSEECSASS